MRWISRLVRLRRRRLHFWAVILAGWLPLTAAAAEPLVSAVTQAARLSVTPGGDSFATQIAGPPPRFVLISRAPNLVTNDSNQALDVFVRDLATRQTWLVSGRAGDGGSGSGDSGNPSASADAQRVAFESQAADLVADDGNQCSDVFLRDLAAETTSLISVAAGSTRSGNGPSGQPAFTPDGAWVAFESAAADLVSNAGSADTNQGTDVFLRDLRGGRTLLISHADGNTNVAANAASRSAVLTPDARCVAFLSTASNLVPGVPASLSGGEVYAGDLDTGVVEWVSRAAHNTASRGALGVFPNTVLHSYNPVLSTNGRWLAFKTVARGGQRALVFRHDRRSDLTQLVSSNAVGNAGGITDTAGPVLSEDGRFLAYEGRTNGPGGFSYASRPVIHLWDAQNPGEIVVSVGADGGSVASGASSNPLLSADGRSLAFLSDATDLVTGLGVAGMQVYWRDLSTGQTRLVSLRPDGVAVEESIVAQPVLSADGLWVGFQARSAHLVPADYNGAYDVFVYDVAGERTSLVSERHAERPSRTGSGASQTSRRAVTPDARWVAFTSLADNLVVADINSQADVFVRDLQSGECELISVAASGSASASGSSRAPAISADGRFVAFSSSAPDVLPATSGVLDTNATEDVFLRDRTGGQTRCLSVNPDGAATGSRASSNPSISADGRYIAFESLASDLVVGDANGRSDVFVHDTQTGANRCLSLRAIGVGTTSQGAAAPVVSSDGRWVVFQSQSRDLTLVIPAGQGALFYLQDLQTGTNRCISSGLPFSFIASRPDPVFSADSTFIAFAWGNNAIYLHDLLANQTALAVQGGANPDISADARFVAYEAASAGATGQIMRLDRQTGARRLLSVTQDGAVPTNPNSRRPLVSADGAFVVYQSRAADLVPGDTNGFLDVFVRDVHQNVAYLVSRSSVASGPANSLTALAALSADGTTVVLHSFATDLMAADHNDRPDIYVVRLGYGDTDHDELPDQWEVTYFGNLARDGAGDFDQDGVSDRNEYLAGTNPLNDASIFQVLTLQSVPEGQTTVVWSAVVGCAYRVQFKDRLEDAAWSEIADLVTATSAQASVTHATGSDPAHRFYRVVLAPAP